MRRIASAAFVVTLGTRHELLMRNMFRPSDGWERFHEGPHCQN
jgi:hypothetical protein